MAAKVLKALVLGGKHGLVGQALVKVLEEKGWDVASVTNAEVDYLSGDFYSNMSRLLDSTGPAHIFNAVAYSNVEQAEDNEEEASILNKRLPAALGRIAKERELPLVHYSTDFVFDGRKGAPYTIDDIPAPLNAYGRTKQEGEQALLSLGLDKCMVIRTAWLFGQGKSNFVRKILGICQEKHEASVVFDQIGSPTYTMDLARHTLELVELGASGLFHIVNSGQANWTELADEAVRCLQMECMINPIPASDFPSKVVRPAYSVLDSTSFTQITSTTPRPWPQALREYLMLEFPVENL
ncbi:dTDP-4-dehydrorhamnose reductase [Desulfovibrio sp. OttesenSCG-928-C06]|nr:dTDP-4-dehydrorhamnose reductase [Desulfovibrio sp. OttesenSCG-928-C06]